MIFIQAVTLADASAVSVYCKQKFASHVTILGSVPGSDFCLHPPAEVDPARQPLWVRWLGFCHTQAMAITGMKQQLGALCLSNKLRIENLKNNVCWYLKCSHLFYSKLEDDVMLLLG